MKIAVATDDKLTVSGHFGRSKYFAVFDVEGGVTKDRQVRPNRFTAHGRGLCRQGHHGRGGHDHDHGGILEALKDCEAALCGGMGWRAAADLSAHGIRPVAVDPGLPLEAAVSAYLAGQATAVPSCEKPEGLAHPPETAR
ncbi:MAG: hypothetical protein KIT09_05505 [Bryobacteraceae bacterium]|nr:hypothetical protein [Bryobacteraceae bacterium]